MKKKDLEKNVSDLENEQFRLAEKMQALEKLNTIEFPQKEGFFTAPSTNVGLHECIKLIMNHLGLKFVSTPAEVKIEKVGE